MVQTLQEEESQVNGIVIAGKAGFSFIDVLFTAIEELLCEAEDIAKW